MTDAEEQPQPSFRCQYCDRGFKRLEHAQRHERTHTKEAPYKCPCGKAFPRRDLLRRHEKSAHNIDTVKRRKSDGTKLDFFGGFREPLPVGLPPIGKSTGLDRSQDLPLAGPHQSGNSASNDKSSNIFSAFSLRDTQPTSTNTQTGGSDFSTLQQAEQVTGQHDALDFDHTDFAFTPLDPFDLLGDGGTLLDNIDFSSFLWSPDAPLDSGILGASQTASEEQARVRQIQSPPAPRHTLDAQTDHQPTSRFGSPLPSTRPTVKVDRRKVADHSVKFPRPLPCWKVTSSDYRRIQEKFEKIAHALPPEFGLPSRHSMSRFLEGCIKGLNEHLPYIHLPTFTPATAAPDLLLAMAAIGAQFKFEGHVAVPLFFAAKAAVAHQLQATKNETVVETLSQPPSLHAGSSTTSPSARDVFATASATLPGPGHQDDLQGSRLQTTQAVLALMVLGSWGPKQLVSEGIAFQSLIAELVRGDGLGPDEDVDPNVGVNLNASWFAWIRVESLRRIKMMAYTFINLQSVAYNIPPSMLTSEIQCCMPVSAEEWNAKTPQAWAEARRVSKIPISSFAASFRSLFRGGDSGNSTPSPPVSSIGNYGLIFAILQCIFFLRQSYTLPSPDGPTNNLRTEDIDTLSKALHNWQSSWENNPEANIEPQSSAGPVAFNSTALLRLAWIRLHSDLGPCRSLASRNPVLIVEAFKSCPPLRRDPGLTPAVLHAAHALSVPVRLGIQFVSKTQTLTWSIQHSLSNLECAIFLSKWFEAITHTVPETPLTGQEKGLIAMIRNIIAETGIFRDDFFRPAVTDEEWQRLIRHMGTAVAILWAEIFSGVHVFDFVSTIGTSLNIYAKMLEATHTPISVPA